MNDILISLIILSEEDVRFDRHCVLSRLFCKVSKSYEEFTVLDILENGHKKCERVAASCLHSGDSRSDYNTHCSKDLPWEIAGSQQNAFLRDVDISSQQGHHFPCCNFHRMCVKDWPGGITVAIMWNNVAEECGIF